MARQYGPPPARRRRTGDGRPTRRGVGRPSGILRVHGPPGPDGGGGCGVGDDAGVRVADVVAWRVQRTPLPLRAARWAAAAGGAVVAVALGLAGLLGGDASGLRELWPERPDRPVMLPGDGRSVVGLPEVTAVGDVPWLPRPLLGPQPLVLAVDGAWRVVGHGPRRVRVPVEDLVVVAATCRSRSTRRRHPTAPWRLRVRDADGVVELRGTWLSLAWLGHLGGWPEPEPPARRHRREDARRR